mmetsp:Transcript_2392/g.5855  ORF Transcript_2392/g.5855 Transcript_2392/m.5855 type:complete len:274 (-) Transcript_2392:676-1497(-)
MSRVWASVWTSLACSASTTPGLDSISMSRSQSFAFTSSCTRCSGRLSSPSSRGRCPTSTSSPSSGHCNLVCCSLSRRSASWPWRLEWRAPSGRSCARCCLGARSSSCSTWAQRRTTSRAPSSMAARVTGRLAVDSSCGTKISPRFTGSCPLRTSTPASSCSGLSCCGARSATGTRRPSTTQATTGERSGQAGPWSSRGYSRPSGSIRWRCSGRSSRTTSSNGSGGWRATARPRKNHGWLGTTRSASTSTLLARPSRCSTCSHPGCAIWSRSSA